MKPFPYYHQRDSMDCGPTCLAMISRHYGKRISIQSLRDKSQIGKEGVSLLGLSEAAESIGFRTKGVQVTLMQLVEEVPFPCIIHWNQKHFVVLYKVKKNRFHIADPGKGLLTLTASEFLQGWISSQENGQGKGVILLLEPTAAFYKNNDEPEDEKISDSALKNIFSYVIPYKKLAFQLFIGIGVASLLQLFLPFLTQSVVDTGINNANIHFVYIILLAQLALFAGRLVVEFVRGWILLHISTRINISILTDFLIKLMKLPVSFFDSKHTGDILQRMNDHSRIESFLTGSSLNVLFSLLNIIILSFVLAIFNIGIFAIFSVASVLYSIWVIMFLKRRRSLDYKKFAIAAKEQSVTIQLVQGMQDIKLNGVEKPMRWTWEGLQAKLFRLNIKSLSLNQWQQAGALFINEGKNIFITFLSAKAVIDGHMTLGSMLAVQYIIGQLNSPIEQLIGFMQSFQNAKISMDRLNEIHALSDEEPAHIHFEQELPLAFRRQLVGGKISGEYFDTHMHFQQVSQEQPGYMSFERTDATCDANINFRNVSFSYPGAGNEPVLRDINLTILKGKTTAIVGVSGSGKTTLLKLLLKFYDPQKGEIKVGDRLLNNISHKTWRGHCGVVMQESFIFSDSIAKNIAVGIDKPDLARLQHAVDIANIREFIEDLPLGYNTKIGSEGSGISMGQKQRILIARAVYRDPEFILFDEATNSLDANNESIILQNLESFFKGRTVVVVAHRLSTVKNADQIILLNKGVISEKGTHEELVALKGEYFKLVKNQLELGK